MRFKEIISTQKIIDTDTGIEYDGLVDDELFDLFNDIANENEILKQQLNQMNDFCAIHAEFLKKEGYTIKDILNYMNERNAVGKRPSRPPTHQD